MTDFPVMKGNANMATGADPYFEVPLFSHVIDNLWQGCSPSEFPDYMEDFDYDPVKAFSKGPITVYLDDDEDKSIKCHWLYEIQPDGYEVKPRFDKILIDSLANKVITWLDEGNKVLVHCQAGLNRSSLIVARVLMKSYNMTAEEAIQHIRDNRSPLCLCNDNFRQWLKGLR